MIGDQFARLMQQQISAAPRLHNLQALFAADDKAVLLDFAGISNLYSNSLGTAAATVGSPVGWHRNLARSTYTPVTFDNGDFATDISNWQKGSAVGTMEWVAGELQFVGGGSLNGSGNNWVRPITTSAPIGTALFGRTVRMAFDATWVSGGNLYCGPSGFLTQISITPESNAGVKTRYTVENVNPTSNTQNRVGVFGAASGAVWRLDNVVIEIFDATDAAQGTTANCPTLSQTPVTGRYWLEADSTDALNLVFPSAPGTMYVGRVTAEGVEWRTEVWGASVNIVEVDAFNAGMVARSRYWSAAEKALVEAYFARQAPSEYVTAAYRVVDNILRGTNVSSEVVNRAESWAAAGYTQFTESGSTITLSSADAIAEFAAPIGARSFKAVNVSLVSGRTYAISVDVIAIELNGGTNISLFETTAAVVAQPKRLATSTGRHAAFFTPTAGTPLGLLRVGITSANGSAARSISLRDFMIQDVTALAAGTLDSFTSRMAAKKYAAGGAIVSGKLVPADGAEISKVMSRHRHVLAVGDSFANDQTDWPTQFYSASGIATTGRGWAGGSLASVICANADAEIEANPGKYSTLIIQGGINDITGSVDPATTRAAVIALVNKCRGLRMAVIMCNVAPWGNASVWDSTKQTNTIAHNDWLAAGGAGADVVVVDIYAALGTPGDPTELLAAYDSGDGLHPNAAGMLVLAQTIAEIL
jgi:lysophospholipase L1-like esterase